MKKEERLQLLDAIRTNDLDYIKKLLLGNTDDWLAVPLLDGLFAFQLAARYGRLEMVQLLLAEHPNLLNSRDVFDQTAILWAAASGHELIVDFLALCGADLSLATNHPGHADDGKSPLYWAIEHKNPIIAQCLINHGASINLRFGEDKLHLIHIASENGCLSVVQSLMEIDSNLLNLVDALGETPIHKAAASGQWHVVDYLATRGADLSLTTNKGKSPLYWATVGGYHNAVRCLINHGADINQRFGEKKLHLIHLASSEGYLDIVSIFLEINSDFLN